MDLDPKESPDSDLTTGLLSCTHYDPVNIVVYCAKSSSFNKKAGSYYIVNVLDRVSIVLQELY